MQTLFLEKNIVWQGFLLSIFFWLTRFVFLGLLSFSILLDIGIGLLNFFGVFFWISLFCLAVLASSGGHVLVDHVKWAIWRSQTENF